MWLEFVFVVLLLFDKYVVFICKGNVIGILWYGEEYLVFDFYCRNE